MRKVFARVGEHPSICLTPFDAKLYGEAMGVGRITLDDAMRSPGGMYRYFSLGLLQSVSFARL